MKHFQKLLALAQWSEKYLYLINLAAQVSPLTDKEKIRSNQILGCQARTWVVIEPQAKSLRASSDSRLVLGLLYLVFELTEFLLKMEYTDKNKISTLEIEEKIKKYLVQANLFDFLSSIRQKGLQALIAKIVKSFLSEKV